MGKSIHDPHKTGHVLITTGSYGPSYVLVHREGESLAFCNPKADSVGSMPLSTITKNVKQIKNPKFFVLSTVNRLQKKKQTENVNYVPYLRNRVESPGLVCISGF